MLCIQSIEISKQFEYWRSRKLGTSDDLIMTLLYCILYTLLWNTLDKTITNLLFLTIAYSKKLILIWLAIKFIINGYLVCWQAFLYKKIQNFNVQYIEIITSNSSFNNANHSYYTTYIYLFHYCISLVNLSAITSAINFTYHSLNTFLVKIVWWHGGSGGIWTPASEETIVVS